jgi:hypothetical protein
MSNLNSYLVNPAISVHDRLHISSYRRCPPRPQAPLGSLNDGCVYDYSCDDFDKVDAIRNKHGFDEIYIEPMDTERIQKTYETPFLRLTS